MDSQRSKSIPKKQGKVQAKQFSKHRNYGNKFIERVVDYFPRDADEDGLVFNKAPIVKGTKPSKSKDKKTEKRAKPTGLSGSLGRATVYEDYDSDEEIEVSKKMKPAQDDDIIEDFGGFGGEGLLGANKEFSSYFKDNRNAFKSLTKMSAFVSFMWDFNSNFFLEL